MGHYLLDILYYAAGHLKDGFTIFSGSRDKTALGSTILNNNVFHTVNYLLYFWHYKAFTTKTVNVNFRKKKENKFLFRQYIKILLFLCCFLTLYWFSIALPHQSSVV